MNNAVKASSDDDFLVYMHTALIAYNKKEQVTNTHIDNGNVFEINPWVKHTEWHNYLNMFKVELFLALIDKPNLDNKPILSVIWDAITELYYIYNKSIASKAGIFIQMETIQDQMHQ